MILGSIPATSQKIRETLPFNLITVYALRIKESTCGENLCSAFEIDALHVGTAQPKEVTPSGHACGSFTYALTFMNKQGIQQGL